jgi:S1-C subfamily serine protease
MLIGLNTENGKIYEEVTLYRSDSARDVSVLLNPKNFHSSHITQKMIKTRAFDIRENVREGVGVVTIGFPLNIGATVYNNQPVARSGIVSQRPQTNGFFLIDAMSNPGNSGSPVYNIHTKKLIGMVSSGPADFLNVYDEKGKIILKIPYNSGLTSCILASEILEMLP